MLYFGWIFLKWSNVICNIQFYISFFSEIPLLFSLTSKISVSSVLQMRFYARSNLKKVYYRWFKFFKSMEITAVFLGVLSVKHCDSVEISFPWQSPLYFYFFKILFIYFLAALGLRCCARAFSSCGERGLLFVVVHVFSLWWLLLLWSTGSRHAGFSSCGMRAQ